MQRGRGDLLASTILALAAAALFIGLALWAAGEGRLASLVWIAGVAPALAALLIDILRSVGAAKLGSRSRRRCR